MTIFFNALYYLIFSFHYGTIILPNSQFRLDWSLNSVLFLFRSSAILPVLLKIHHDCLESSLHGLPERSGFIPILLSYEEYL